jgi:hypothetical protein
MPCEYGPNTSPAAHIARGLRWRNALALVLGIIGCIQMVGYVTGNVVLRGLGAATTASPLPKVFSDVDGLETFASEFTLHYRDGAGTVRELPITPELYGRLGGPYNRRNVYGAALSYAPRLPAGLWESAYCYGFAPDGPLRRELGLGREAADIRVTIRTRTQGRYNVWTLEPSCKP